MFEIFRSVKLKIYITNMYSLQFAEIDTRKKIK